MQVFAGVASRFPNALIGLLPILAHIVDDAADTTPVCVRNGFTVFVAKVNGIEESTKDVKLDLPGSRISNPDRLRAPVSLEVIKTDLFRHGTAVVRIHHLQVAAGTSGCSLCDPPSERNGLFLITETHQAVDSERGVADPRRA